MFINEIIHKVNNILYLFMLFMCIKLGKTRLICLDWPTQTQFIQTIQFARTWISDKAYSTKPGLIQVKRNLFVESFKLLSPTYIGTNPIKKIASMEI